MLRVSPQASERGRRASAGQAVIESIVSLILFVMMLGLIMAISVYLYFQQALVTAAREGAREASLNADLGSLSSESGGIADVEDYVANEIQQLTGQVIGNNANIVVTPPSASASQVPGERTVRVDISWSLNNPVGIGNFLTAMGGDGSAFTTIPVSATATMRYEE